jgi:cell division protein FtsL
MLKKNNLIVIIVIFIVLVIVAILFTKIGHQNKGNVPPLSQSDIELNQAISSDTTKSISDNINSIKLEDTSGDTDLQNIDKELEKL